MAQRLYGKAVSASGVRTEALQPAPLQSDTFVRAPQRQAGGNAMALADALSRLNTSLMDFGSQKAALDRDPNSRQNIEYEQSLAGMTPEQRMAEAERTDLTFVQSQKLGVILGVDQAAKWQAETLEWMATDEFDPNGDVAGQLESRQQAFLAALPSDAARAAAVKANFQFLQTQSLEKTAQVVQEAAIARDNAIGVGARLIIKQNAERLNDRTGRPMPVSAKDTAAQVIESLEQGLGVDMTPEQARNTLLSIIQEQAEAGNAELVEALITADRPNVGPIGNVLGLQPDLQNIRDLAVKRQFENIRDDSQLPYVDLVVASRETGGATEANIRKWEAEHGPLEPGVREQLLITNGQTLVQLRAQQETADLKLAIKTTQEAAALTGSNAAAVAAATGTWHELAGYETVDDSGDTKYITGDQQREAFRDQWLRILNDNGEITEEERRYQKIIFAQKTGTVIPDWKTLFENGAASANLPSLTAKDGTVPQATIESLTLYRTLKAEGGMDLLAKHMTQDDMDFFETADVMMLSTGNERDALLQAVVVRNNPASDYAPIDMDTVVNDLAKSRTNFLGWGPQAQNSATVAPLVRDTANVYRRAGMGKEAAIERAMERINASYSMINGYLIYTADENVPPDFVPLATGMLQTYFNEHGEEEGIEDATDLVVIPAGSKSSVGGYLIWNSKTGLPVENMESRAFTLGDIFKYRERVKAADRLILQTTADERRGAEEAARRRASTFKPRFAK